MSETRRSKRKITNNIDKLEKSKVGKTRHKTLSQNLRHISLKKQFMLKGKKRKEIKIKLSTTKQ